jgi:hypothetical protein
MAGPPRRLKVFGWTGVGGSLYDPFGVLQGTLDLAAGRGVPFLGLSRTGVRSIGNYRPCRVQLQIGTPPPLGVPKRPRGPDTRRLPLHRGHRSLARFPVVEACGDRARAWFRF